MVALLIRLILTLREVYLCYKFSNSEKIKHFLFVSDQRLFAKSEKALDSLIQTVRVVSDGIGMEFGIDK